MAAEEDKEEDDEEQSDRGWAAATELTMGLPSLLHHHRGVAATVTVAEAAVAVEGSATRSPTRNGSPCLTTTTTLVSVGATRTVATETVSNTRDAF